MFMPFMFWIQILGYTYFDLSISDCKVLTKCRWCAAGDLIGYFSLMILKVTNKKTKHEMAELSLILA